MFADWIMTVAAMGVISALLEALLPDGGTRNTARLVIGLVMLVCIASPLARLLGQGGVS